MAVKYYLHQNAIASNPESQKAVIVPNKVNTLPSIIDIMVKKGTTVSEADILATLHLLVEVITEELQEGNHVNLPFVNLKPGISGEFKSSSDSFDATRHQLKATASIGPSVRKSMAQAKVEKIQKSLTSPQLIAFKDIVSQTINTVVSPGGIGEIIGNHLKYQSENLLEGIYFVATNQTEYKVQQVAKRTLGKLLFKIPEMLPAGNYALVVRRAFGTSNTSIREGVLANHLLVE